MNNRKDALAEVEDKLDQDINDDDPIGYFDKNLGKFVKDVKKRRDHK